MIDKPLDKPPIGLGREQIVTNLPPLDLDVKAGRALSPQQVVQVRYEVARTLYALLRSDEASVVEMSEDEFVAFCERVMSEGK